jgi:hypothetical protein
MEEKHDDLKTIRQIPRRALGLLIVLLLQAGCSAGVANTGAIKSNAVDTATPVLATVASTPTDTTQPVQPTATIAETPSSGVCNQAQVTSAGGSTAELSVSAGAAFTQTWRLQNAGSCTWTTEYSLDFVNGVDMGGPAQVALPKAVKPGESVDLSVKLTAPTEAGAYQATWSLRDENGVDVQQAGTDSSFLTLSVQVTGGVSVVTGVDLAVTPAVYNGLCPTTLTLSATITSSAPGTVRYYWSYSDGSRSREVSFQMTAAGSQNITQAFSLGYPSVLIDGWDQINIVQEGQPLTARAAYHLDCSSQRNSGQQPAKPGLHGKP